MIFLVPLIPLIPLVGFVLTGLFGRSNQKEIHKVAIWAVVASWVVSMVVAFGALSHGFGFGDDGAGIALWNWIPATGLTPSAGL